MERYTPFFNLQEVEKTDKGKYKASYKFHGSKPTVRYFDDKDAAERFEKTGSSRSETKAKSLPDKISDKHVGKEINPGDSSHGYKITKQDVSASKLKDKESGEVNGKYYYKDKRLSHKDNPYGVYEFKNKKEFEDWKNGTDKEDPDFKLDNAIKHAKNKTPSKWKER